MKYSFFALFFTFALSANELSNEKIIQSIIQDSISSYRGNCPCPYNLASNGSKCGRRSAYSKLGGYSPVCYPSDVTEEMISRYKLQKSN